MCSLGEKWTVFKISRLVVEWARREEGGREGRRGDRDMGRERRRGEGGRRAGQCSYQGEFLPPCVLLWKFDGETSAR